MVDMPVCQKHVINRYHLVRSLSDIETDVELRQGDHRLFGGDRIADYLQIIYLQFRKVVAGHIESLRSVQNPNGRRASPRCQFILTFARL